MEPVAEAPDGKLRGLAAGGVLTFRGVRYATARRFAAPEPVPAWPGVLDATEHGQVSPQPPSRLDGVMGPPRDEQVQGEDCLNLTITTPGTTGRRPVLVWLHGGAFSSGAGSLNWYDGRALAAQGDVVVAGVNYRLGALGFLRRPGVSPGNLGLLDQLAALRWIQRNIAAFGGDPECVTVLGQSAGAQSIACLLAAGVADGLLHRAIMQSAPLALKLMDTAATAKTASRFLAALDADPRTAPIERVLAAQRATAVKAAGPAGLRTMPVFAPAAGAPPFGHGTGMDRLAESARKVDVLIGTTADELDAFLEPNPAVAKAKRLIGDRPVAAAKAALTERFFAGPSLRLADELAANGGNVYSYRFGWRPPHGRFGACHCIELPFLFGDEESWLGSPMLGDAPWETVRTLGHTLREAWLSFARHGDPAATGAVTWPAHTPGRPPTPLP
ncbi:carboxylesterase/lipase family protein [Amycolatopsis nigrescens]|uniref:carboxylesterase/lipase family protein n=1 Tax=Amycolatopsis nigrescens TaxID=381445 RepID=UPI00036B10F0|nr:carboxylesterase family protein [Amycolatopsis nigrescens]